MGYLDYKTTSWKRVFVPDDRLDVIEQLIKGKNLDHNTLIDFINDNSTVFTPLDIDGELDCEEVMSSEDNGDQSTIELYKDNEMLIDNSINSFGK